MQNVCLRPRCTVTSFRERNGRYYPFQQTANADLEDIGHEYRFSRVTPGVSADQLRVEVQGPVLRVQALTEVPGKRFDWHVIIPDDVSYENITANVHNGVLNVHFPKLPPKDIPVTTSDTTGTAAVQELWRLENWLNEYRLTHPAPGVTASDVVIDVAEDFLFVKVKGPNGRFTREVSLPPAVDVNAITFEVENGLLSITLPKMHRDEIQLRCSLDGASGSSALGSEDEEALYNDARQSIS